MLHPTSITDGIQIAKSPDTTSDTFGSLTANSSAEVLLVVANDTSSSLIINIGVGYSDTNSLNLPTDRYLITEEYEEPMKTAVEYLTNFYNTGTATQERTANNVTYEYRKDISMMTDIGGNLRYYGADPDNYVMFNNELWRIIGVFNNIDDGTGKKETRVKIAKSTPLSTSYAWDSAGTNNWTNSSLKTYLNGDYLSSITTSSLIGDAIWDIRGPSNNSLYANDYYNVERTTGTAPSSTTAVTWPGKIALMYLSDYMYAGDLISCKYAGSSLSSDTANCRDKSWLRSTTMTQWTLLPYSINTSAVLFVNARGGVLGNKSTLSNYVRPVLYLNSNVKIVDGTGKSGDEFILG